MDDEDIITAAAELVNKGVHHNLHNAFSVGAEFRALCEAFGVDPENPETIEFDSED